MKELGEKLKKLRLSKGYTQRRLAEELELTSDSTISQWERGINSPYGKDLIKLSDIFGVTSDYMLGIDSVNESKAEYKIEPIEYTYFPTAISAGLPLEVDGITDSKKITVSDEFLGKWKSHKDIFFARIYGDSMDKLMDDGSLIAIKPVQSVEELRNGDIVVYSLNGEYSVKKYSRQGDTIIFKPQSYNDAHFDQVYNVDDDIKIHGIVVTYVVNR